MPVEHAVRIEAQPLTAGAFAPFGDALVVPGEAAGRAINDGRAERFDGLAALDLLRAGGQPCLTLFRSPGVPAGAPGPLTVLERHMLGSQTFVPLAQARLIVVVAPNLPDGGGPDETALSAFTVMPGQGVTLRAGVWHHPMITWGPGDVLVIERGAAQVDCEVRPLTGVRVLAPWTG